jgi:hypothetical protein
MGSAGMGPAAGGPTGGPGGMAKPEMGRLGQAANSQMGDAMQNKNPGGLPNAPKPGAGYNPLADASLTSPAAINQQNAQMAGRGPLNIQNLPSNMRQIQQGGPQPGAGPLAQFQAKQPGQLPQTGQLQRFSELRDTMGKLPQGGSPAQGGLQGNPLQGILSGMTGGMKPPAGPIGGPSTLGQNMQTMDIRRLPTTQMPPQNRGTSTPGPKPPGGGPGGMTPSQAGGK